LRILVTGCAGFIGNSLARRLLADGHVVVGIDNVNDYYDPSLKEARLGLLAPEASFTFHRADIVDPAAVAAVFSGERFDAVVHLAAQAGVRYSMQNPRAYVDANVMGFLNVIEGCRHHAAGHLVYASTSSVYGLNARMPLSAHRPADHPISLYAATKKANEAMAHAYAHMFGLRATGLRFFTVYGPWGRPDMAFFLFTKAILEGQPLRIFGDGHQRRDFTYVADLVEVLTRVVGGSGAEPDPRFDASEPDPATSSAPYRLLNVGNGQSVDLLRCIGILEEILGRKAELVFEAAAPGDVTATLAEVSDLVTDFGFTPATPVEEGIRRFVAWYREYYRA